jgi:hypothetical protein
MAVRERENVVIRQEVRKKRERVLVQFGYVKV